jgi:hypothetical protein
MVTQTPSKPLCASASARRPRVTSYDTGYEHGLQHWLDVEKMVEAADAELLSAAEPLVRAQAS